MNMWYKSIRKNLNLTQRPEIFVRNHMISRLLIMIRRGAFSADSVWVSDRWRSVLSINLATIITVHYSQLATSSLRDFRWFHMIITDTVWSTSTETQTWFALIKQGEVCSMSSSIIEKSTLKIQGSMALKLTQNKWLTFLWTIRRLWTTILIKQILLRTQLWIRMNQTKVSLPRKAKCKTKKDKSPALLCQPSLKWT